MSAPAAAPDPNHRSDWTDLYRRSQEHAAEGHREDAGEVLTEAYSLGIRKGMQRVTEISVVEHAIRMAGGGMQVRNAAPHVDRILPLAKWIESEQLHGGKVHTRRIVVLEDWIEVSPC